MANITYVRKVTASLGWLRSLAALIDPNTGEVVRPEAPACPLMRVKCEVECGWGETGPLGDYIRFEGKFLAQVVERDGSVRLYAARNAIFPKLGEDFIASEMTMKSVETKVKGRDGRYYEPRREAEAGTEAAVLERWAGVLDFWIAPPPADKPTTSGYVFELRVPWQRERFDTMQHIGTDLPDFAAPALEAPSPAPEATAENIAEPAPAGSHDAGNAEHVTGKRGRHRDAA